MTRNPLNNRRAQTTLELEHNGIHYYVSAGHRLDGSVGEVFVQTRKTSNEIEGLARDSAILISLGLQHGCFLATMREGVTRNRDGSPATLVGAVLDALEGI